MSKKQLIRGAFGVGATRRRLSGLCGLAMLLALLPSSTHGAAGAIHALSTTGASNWSTSTWSNGVPTNVPGEIASNTTGLAASTTTLDISVTLGAIRHTNGSNTWQISSSGSNTITMDGTGLTTSTNPLGVANEASISVQVNTVGLVVQPNIIMMSDLGIGSVNSNSNGALSISGNITNASGSSKNLNFRNFRNGTTVSGNIGLTGDDIVIVNQPTAGTVATTVTLSGSLGSKVTSVTQNNGQSAGTATLVLSGDNSAFSGPINLQAGTLDLRHANALGATGAGGTLTISGGTRLTNGSAGAVTLLSTGNQIWNGDFTYNAAQQLNMGTGAVTLNANVTVTVANAALTVGGGISGSGFGITKGSTNTLVLGGVNTLTGALAVGTVATASTGGGTFRVGSTVTGNGSVNNVSSVTAVGTSSLFELNNTISASERLNDSATVTVSLGGIFTLLNNTTANTFLRERIGGLTVDAGQSTVNVTNTSSGVLDELAVGSSGFSRVNAGTALIRGTSLGVTATNATRITIDGVNGTGLTFGGSTVVSSAGAGGGSVKNLRIIPYLLGSDATNTSFLTYDTNVTTGGLRLLNLTNEYDVLATSSTGYVTSGNNVSFSVSGTLTLSAGTSRTLNSLLLGNNNTIAAGSTSDNLTIDSGAIISTGATTNLSNFGKVTLGNDEGVIFGVGATFNMNSPVDVTNGGGLVKAGAGTLVLAKTNLYTGTTTINQGTLRIGDGTNGNLATGSGAIIAQVATTLNINMGAAATLANDVVNNGTVSKTLGATVNTLSGNITGTGVVVQNIAGGTLVLSGTNSYAGTTTVTTGKLLLNGTHAIAGATNVGNYTVSSTATLGGGGSTDAAVTVSNGAFLAPGDGIGTLGTGNITFGGTATFQAQADLTSNTKVFANGTFYNSDTLAVTGTVALASSILELDLGTEIATYSPGRTIVLITNDGTEAVSGTFSQIRPANGSPLVAFTISYAFDADNSGAANDVAITFTSVPEPGAISLVFAVACGTLIRRRRRGKTLDFTGLAS